MNDKWILIVLSCVFHNPLQHDYSCSREITLDFIGSIVPVVKSWLNVKTHDLAKNDKIHPNQGFALEVDISFQKSFIFHRGGKYHNILHLELINHIITMVAQRASPLQLRQDKPWL